MMGGKQSDYRMHRRKLLKVWLDDGLTVVLDDLLKVLAATEPDLGKDSPYRKLRLARDWIEAREKASPNLTESSRPNVRPSGAATDLPAAWIAKRGRQAASVNTSTVLPKYLVLPPDDETYS